MADRRGSVSVSVSVRDTYAEEGPGYRARIEVPVQVEVCVGYTAYGVVVFLGEGYRVEVRRLVQDGRDTPREILLAVERLPLAQERMIKAALAIVNGDK